MGWNSNGPWSLPYADRSGLSGNTTGAAPSAPAPAADNSESKVGQSPNMVPPIAFATGGGLDWLNAAATIGTGIMGFMGGESANNTNAEQAEKNRAFNAQQADITRKWQEQMRGSAYQASMEDMRKAGLNPMLAFSQGGTATPGGASASGSPTPAAENKLGAAIQSAMSARRLMADLRTAELGNTLQAAQAVTETARAHREIADAKSAEADTQLKNAMTPGARKRSALTEKYGEAEAVGGLIKTGSGVVRDAIGGITDIFPATRTYKNIRGHRGYSERDMLDAAKGKGVLLGN